METAVKITKKAKNNSFEDCKIYGALDDSGKNNKYRKTSIGLKDFTDNHPILYGTISAVFGGVITLIVEYAFFK